MKTSIRDAVSFFESIGAVEEKQAEADVTRPGEMPNVLCTQAKINMQRVTKRLSVSWGCKNRNPGLRLFIRYAYEAWRVAMSVYPE